MKYIIDLPLGGWDLQKYFRYLSEVKGQLPLDVFRFASDPRNYDLESHQSLHDAWLECLLITEPAAGSRSERRQIQIDCKFLGPYHDLFIHVTYFGVTGYSLTLPDGGGIESERRIGHGDLLMHEVRLGNNAQVIHELLFSKGSVFEVSCTHFSHRVEHREAPSGGNA